MNPNLSPIVRPLEADETSLLRAATLTNLNWATTRFTDREIDGIPSLARYYLGFRPEAGDFGLVADVGGTPVGVVWLLFLDEPDAGYGFVSSGIPELSVTVFDGHRGAGVGSNLVRAALQAARERSISAVSLSVERGNSARRLYEAFGFVEVPNAYFDGAMLIEFREH